MNIPQDDGADELVLNLTPMIDVVFLLLIFFMVATTFLDPEREIDLELPEAESGSAAEQELDEIVINVRRDGAIVFRGETWERGAFVAELKRLARIDPETPVTIRGDREAHHQHIVGVMDACGVAGFVSLAVGTLEGS